MRCLTIALTHTHCPTPVAMGHLPLALHNQPEGAVATGAALLASAGHSAEGAEEGCNTRGWRLWAGVPGEAWQQVLRPQVPQQSPSPGDGPAGLASSSPAFRTAFWPPILIHLRLVCQSTFFLLTCCLRCRGAHLACCVFCCTSQHSATGFKAVPSDHAHSIGLAHSVQCGDCSFACKTSAWLTPASEPHSHVMVRQHGRSH